MQAPLRRYEVLMFGRAIAMANHALTSQHEVYSSVEW